MVTMPVSSIPKDLLDQAAAAIVSANKQKEKNPEIHVYLSGPDVFFEKSMKDPALGKQKKELLKKNGMIGHYPLDNVIPPEAFKNPQNASMLIGAANEKMMRDCCKDGQIGVILVNMEPFDGPSMDNGTAFEAGYMSALADIKKNVIIVGYSSKYKTELKDRVINDIYHNDNNITTDAEFSLRAKDGRIIENFGNTENLMVPQAIHKTGGKIVASFEEAVQLAHELAVKKIHELEKEKSTGLPPVVKKQGVGHG